MPFSSAVLKRVDSVEHIPMHALQGRIRRGWKQSPQCGPGAAPGQRNEVSMKLATFS